MKQNKPRLQLAIYDRPEDPGTYHYALFIAGPKPEFDSTIRKYHIKNTIQLDQDGNAIPRWQYEHIDCQPSTGDEPSLIARIIIAKLVSDRLYDTEKLFWNIPLYQIDDYDANTLQAKEFSSRTWTRDAVEELRNGGAVAGKMKSWQHIERRSSEYVEKKRKQSRRDSPAAPMLDLMKGKEVLP